MEPYQVGLLGFFSLHRDTNLLLREKTCYLWCLKLIRGQRCLSNRFHLNQFHLSPYTARGDLQLSHRLRAAETLPDSRPELSRSQPWFLPAVGEDRLCRWGREQGLPVLLNKSPRSLRDLQAQPVPAVIHRAGLCSAPWLTAAPALLRQPLPAPSATGIAPHAALQSRLRHCALSLLPPRHWHSTDARWQDKLNWWSRGSWMMERAGKTQ